MKIMLPSRRNANFHKIQVFAFKPKITKKSVDFGGPKPWKINGNPLKRKLKKQSDFQVRFLLIFSSNLGPPNGSQTLQNRALLASWALQALQKPKRRPKTPPNAFQEGPRGPKWGHKASQEGPKSHSDRPKNATGLAKIARTRPQERPRFLQCNPMVPNHAQPN